MLQTSCKSSLSGPAPRSASLSKITRPSRGQSKRKHARNTPQPAQAIPETADLAAGAAVDSGSIAVAGGLALVGLAGAVLATDPQKRRDSQMREEGGDEMETVKNYFNSEGFDRWKRIYGETDDVNKVQMDIREGHGQTIAKVLAMLQEEGGVDGQTVCDAGCGTGSLGIPLALSGALVSCSDISSAMVGEAKARYEDAIQQGAPKPAKDPVFEAKDLESISGSFDNVICLDVMIHYPQDKASGMIQHLASLAEKRLIISFAPKTTYFSVLKRIGELFPGPSKATRAYLHAEADVEKSLNDAGWKVVKRDMTSTNFYFSRLLEAVRA